MGRHKQGKAMNRIIKPGEPGFHINLGRYVESEGHTRVGVEGFYVGCAIKPGVGVVRSFGMPMPVPNLITNIGLDALGSTSPNFLFMHLGTGTTTPAFTDTALTTFGVSVTAAAAVTTQSNSIATSSPYYVQGIRTWTSSVGGATGTWTEIGISSTSTNGNLRSHALILDGGGSPVAFTVKADEQFQGSYIWRYYPTLTDDTRTITIGAASYDTITRACNVTTLNELAPLSWWPLINSGPFRQATSDSVGTVFYTGKIAAITSEPTGGLSGVVSGGSAAYTNGNHYNDSFYRAGPGSAVGNIRTFARRMGATCWQCQYDPVLPKLTTQEVIHNQRVSWARR